MKFYSITFSNVSFFLIVLSNNIIAQSFTRVFDGDIVNDDGNSICACWGDYNNDSYQDLFVGNKDGENNYLYTNNGDGSFQSTISSILSNDGGNSRGCSWVDFDNDGDLDLFVANFGEKDFLYRNTGDGRFDKMLSSTIVKDATSSTGVAWGDYDNDGWLDIYVSGYNSDNRLYRNLVDSFDLMGIDVIQRDGGASVGVNWVDYDNDNDLDLYICNRFAQDNFFYENNGDGSFSRNIIALIAKDGSYGQSSCWGDVDNDGDFDVILNTDNEENNLYFLNNGDGSFSKNVTDIVATESLNSYANGWADFNNDGYIDLFVGNTFSTSSRDNVLYMGTGSGNFSRILTGDIITDGGGSVSAAWADIDNDGDMDLFVANNNRSNFLYRNESTFNSWINIECVGIISNSSAVGAKIEVLARIFGQTIWQFHEISSQTGRFSQNSLNVEFGLGDASIVDSLVIKWPSGLICEYSDVPIDTFLIYYEECARPLADFEISHDTICQGECIDLNNLSVNSNSWQWSFEGSIPSSSTVQNLSNVCFSDIGSNLITLVASNIVGSDSAEYSVVVIPSPDIYLGADSSICNMDSIQLDATHQNAAYVWSDGSSDPQVTIFESGRYSVIVDVNGCLSSDTIEIDVFDEPVVNLGNDTIICVDEAFILDAHVPGVTDYIWQDGSRDSIFSARESGLYFVLARSICGESVDTINLNVNGPLGELNLGGSSNLCSGDSIILDASVQNGDSYLWSNGSLMPEIIIQTPGEYMVQVSNECEEISDNINITSDECCGLFVPDAFTPNADNTNDDFKVYFSVGGECSEITSYSLRIFNRWGGQVFYTKNISDCWDGKFVSEAVEEGIYAWLIEYNDGVSKVTRHGNVTVIR